jgi:hypothetical protein
MNRIVIELEAEEEDESPEHSERVTHSTPGYAEAVRKVMKKAIGKWGWCTATVTVKVFDRYNRPIAEGTDYLGNCSYHSAVDFARNSGYFEDMVKEATEKALMKFKKSLDRRVARLERESSNRRSK